jgi:hypothetical protein
MSSGYCDEGISSGLCLAVDFFDVVTSKGEDPKQHFVEKNSIKRM